MLLFTKVYCLLTCVTTEAGFLLQRLSAKIAWTFLSCPLQGTFHFSSKRMRAVANAELLCKDCWWLQTYPVLATEEMRANTQVCALSVCSITCVKALICSTEEFSEMHTFHEAETSGETIEDKQNKCVLDLVFSTIRRFCYWLQTWQKGNRYLRERTQFICWHKQSRETNAWSK